MIENNFLTMFGNPKNAKRGQSYKGKFEFKIKISKWKKASL